MRGALWYREVYFLLEGIVMGFFLCTACSFDGLPLLSVSMGLFSLLLSFSFERFLFVSYCAFWALHSGKPV
jgi:hypothetical protein